MAPAEPILDLAFLDRQTFGDAALAREVLDLFRHQAERLLPEFEGAAADRQSDLAHLLKGSCLGIGAARAAVLLQAFGAADAAGRSIRFPELQRAFEELDRAIAAHLAAR